MRRPHVALWIKCGLTRLEPPLKDLPMSFGLWPPRWLYRRIYAWAVRRVDRYYSIFDPEEVEACRRWNRSHGSTTLTGKLHR